MHKLHLNSNTSVIGIGTALFLPILEINSIKTRDSVPSENKIKMHRKISKQEYDQPDQSDNEENRFLIQLF